MTEILTPTPAAAPHVILLGLGFTTTRLARRLLARGLSCFAVVRQPDRYAGLAALGLNLVEYGSEASTHVPKGGVLIHTVPPLPVEENSQLRATICALEPRRVVYISSTSVYGDQKAVDIYTLAAPSEEKGQRRVEEENWLLSGNWSNLILRAAAIYGPGRGIHVRLRDGRPPRISGAAASGIVSRIHAEDLAIILEEGSLSNLEGAWPVADGQPSSTAEITDWCSELLQLGKPAAKQEGDVGSNLPISGRTVHGEAILAALGTQLLYPGYVTGILASLAEESAQTENTSKRVSATN